MKKYFLIFAAALVALVACERAEEGNDGGNDGGKDNPVVVADAVTLSSDAVVSIEGSSTIVPIKFNATTAWTAAASDEFIVLNATSGEAGDVELKATVQSLPDDTDGRIATVTITAGEASAVVTIYQGVVFELSSTWAEFGVEGGTMDFTLVTNLEYTVTTYDVFDWAPLEFDKTTGAGKITVAANNGYDARTAYVKFTIPAIQDPVFDDDGNDTGETKDHVERVYVAQEGNVKFAWTQDFFWTMFSEGARHSVALVGDYFVINAPVDANNSTGGLLVFKKDDGSYVKKITSPVSFTGITNDDKGNVVLTAGGDYPIDEEFWSLIVDEQTPLTVYFISAADAAAAIASGSVPEISPVITYANEFYGYGLDNVRVTGDVFGNAVIAMVSAAYQEEGTTSEFWNCRTVAWQVTGGVVSNAPAASRTVPAYMSIWTPADLVSIHLDTDANGPVFYMGYDGNYQLWYASSMSADWQDVLDSGSSWIEGYGSMDLIEWNGHKYLGLVAETYFAWYGWGSLPSYLWIINIDDPTAPEAIAKTPIDLTGTEGSWQYGATADLVLAVEGNDLVAYVVDAGVSLYTKVVYPVL